MTLESNKNEINNKLIKPFNAFNEQLILLLNKWGRGSMVQHLLCKQAILWVRFPSPPQLKYICLYSTVASAAHL